VRVRGQATYYPSSLAFQDLGATSNVRQLTLDTGHCGGGGGLVQGLENRLLHKKATKEISTDFKATGRCILGEVWFCVPGKLKT